MRTGRGLGRWGERRYPPLPAAAEEKRALALFNYEEKAAREAKLMAEFRAMLAAKDAPGPEGPAGADEGAGTDAGAGGHA